MHTDLSTTEIDGRRKWIFPQYISGLWWHRRRIVAILLMAWLFIAPWIKIGGHQAIFFDLVQRKIHFLGLTLWINELNAVLFFLLFVFSMILLFTVVLGRIFCGWGCPITVFMEFVFRPIERLLEGEGAQHKNFYSQPVAKRFGRQTIKYALFFCISVLLGNTFVAYFMGSHRLFPMIADGPAEHWGPFIFMLISSGLIFFQYSWFREQICLFVCPYGRLQSVLLDRDSLIVAYDQKRGEPRGKLGSTSGDCIDCKLCVRVCPTGIDIRNGLQLECIHCTACVDACNTIMDKIKKPQNLIRYQTEREVDGEKRRLLRPRLLIYSAVLLLSSTLLVGYVSSRGDFRLTLHRESRDLFTVQEDHWVVNPYRINAINLREKEVSIQIKPLSSEELVIEIPEGPIVLKPLEKKAFHILLKIPKEKFRGTYGILNIRMMASDQDTPQQTEIEARLVGPVFN